MYRLNDIRNAMKSLVGWRQPYNPSERLDDWLEDSESGLYYQDAHPLLTLDNIKAVMPEDFLFTYPRWNMLIPYKKGMKVRHNDTVFMATVDNTGVEPNTNDFNDDYNDDFDNPTWVVYNYLSDYIATLTEQGITHTIQQFYTTKQIEKETKNLFDRKCLFDGAGRLMNTIQNKGRIVGYEITPVRSMGITTRIERIGLQMKGATGTVRLYLFHSSQPNPIKIKDVNITEGNGGFQWFNVGWDLPYVSDLNNAGGTWYVCYNQADLPQFMEAVNIARDWTREPCGTCNVGNAQVWREMQKYFTLMPFLTKPTNDFYESPSLFDIGTIVTTNTTSYGINLELSVGCDLTDFIISQKRIFADVLQKQVTADILRLIALNPNVQVNRQQVNVQRDEIYYELDGQPDGNGTRGLGHELKRAYKALELDTKGLDRLCLACHNGGVRYKST